MKAMLATTKYYFVHGYLLRPQGALPVCGVYAVEKKMDAAEAFLTIKQWIADAAAIQREAVDIDRFERVE